jgi:hypothetical protein
MRAGREAERKRRQMGQFLVAHDVAAAFSPLLRVTLCTNFVYPVDSAAVLLQRNCPKVRYRDVPKHLPLSDIICAIGVHVYVFIGCFLAAPLVHSAAAQYLCGTGRIKGERK